MFSSVALDVVIGLLFIYLLYSLLASVLSEIIATKLSLRARNLKEAVNRMLTDEQEATWLGRLSNSLRILKNPQSEIIREFYDNPEIKYLGSPGVFKEPSSFKSSSFAKTVMGILFGNSLPSNEAVTKKLQEIIQKSTEKSGNRILDPQTAQYIQTLWEESGKDVKKFKTQLENWFDRTMEQATEWYKRKIQVVLLTLGFCIAWFFNVDTFVVAKKLSHDKDARDKMVSMANAYMKSNKVIVGKVNDDSFKVKSDSLLLAKQDSLFQIKKILDKDIADAGSILGTGAWLPDRVKFTIDPKTKEITFTPQIDAFLIKDVNKKIAASLKSKTPGYIQTDTWCNKLGYFFALLPAHFFGFLITAIAISLGAPFWFDLLNKLMKFRTSPKSDAGGSENSTSAPQPVTIQVVTKAEDKKEE